MSHQGLNQLEESLNTTNRLFCDKAVEITGVPRENLPIIMTRLPRISVQPTLEFKNNF